ncbi:MAG: hypothetical protein UX68_C0010G0023 [Parcubacteria group bacterium GW2011_GWA2_46_9]|nr:MAG: hypothetical protein UX68_C0010G0023 [Parcubacteria group bacterium GW2011_GWA2_46_9]
MIRRNSAIALTITAIAWTLQVQAMSCPGCLGDDNGNNNGIVTVNELVGCIDNALSGCPISGEPCQCECDGNGDGRVTIDELLGAVNNALNGCGLSSPRQRQPLP